MTLSFYYHFDRLNIKKMFLTIYGFFWQNTMIQVAGLAIAHTIESIAFSIPAIVQSGSLPA
jgi:hypothetical protein